MNETIKMLVERKEKKKTKRLIKTCIQIDAVTPTASLLITLSFFSALSSSDHIVTHIFFFSYLDCHIFIHKELDSPLFEFLENSLSNLHPCYECRTGRLFFSVLIIFIYLFVVVFLKIPRLHSIEKVWKEWLYSRVLRQRVSRHWLVVIRICKCLGTDPFSDVLR